MYSSRQARHPRHARAGRDSIHTEGASRGKVSSLTNREEPPGARRQFIGTARFPDATDLSEYVVHLTSTANNLANIMVTGCIQAKTAHGLGRDVPQVRPLHLSVHLTESPVTELSRIAKRKGYYGIAFSQDFVKQASGQRVWYLDKDSEPLTCLLGILKIACDAGDWDAPIWRATPFIDQVVAGRYEFTHEREWRVSGARGLRFEWADVAFILTPQGTVMEVNDDPALSRPIGDHEGYGVYEWEDGSIPEIDSRMTELYEEFHRTFVSIEDAGLYYDAEDEDGFATPGYERFDTCDAIEHIFGDYPEVVRLALEDHLYRTAASQGWLLTAEIAEFEEEARLRYEEQRSRDQQGD